MSVNLLRKNKVLEAMSAPPRIRECFEGRYMLLGVGEEYACRTFELSCDGLSLFAPVAAEAGEKVVLYLNELGRFTGVVRRATEIGFDMSLQLTERKRARLVSQLAWYADRAAMSVDERRRHERFAPLMELTLLRLTRGDELIARIRSLSLSGVSIETDHIIPMGAEVTIGKTPARVVRILDDGVACEFVRPFLPGEIDERTRL